MKRILAMCLWVGCTGGDASTCDDVQSDTVTSLHEVAEAHQACTVDEDCEVVSLSGDCFAGCPTIVGTGGAAAIEEAVTAANEDVCADHPECEAIELPCDPEAPPVCTDGVCGGV